MLWLIGCTVTALGGAAVKTPATVQNNLIAEQIPS